MKYRDYALGRGKVFMQLLIMSRTMAEPVVLEAIWLKSTCLYTGISKERVNITPFSTSGNNSSPRPTLQNSSLWIPHSLSNEKDLVSSAGQGT
jgi:hypothetical protein